MKKVVDYIKGTVRVRTECRFPERVINICAGRGVQFWDLERRSDGSAEMTVYIDGYRKLRESSRESGIFTVKPVRRTGVPFFAHRIRKRYVLIFGMVLCLALAWISSFFVWQIEVSGNEKVSSEKIIATLRKIGVDIGTCTLNMENRYIADRLLLTIPELSWAAVNTHGSRAYVIVREKINKPELIDKSVPTDVFAAKEGIIEKLTVNGGSAVVSKGEAVSEGDMLVTGTVKSTTSGDRLVRADAEVWARTLYVLSAEMPLSFTGKEYTGAEETKTALIIGGKRLNLYFSGGNPYDNCDKITEYKYTTLPGGSALPLTVVSERYAEYEPSVRVLSQAESERILKSHLMSELSEKLGGGYVINAEYNTETSDGLVTVTVTAECMEEIGVIRKMDIDGS